MSKIRTHEPLMPERWSTTGNDLEVRISVPGLSHKHMESPHIQQALTLEMIDRRYPHSEWTHVYTDGSATEAVRNGGSGVYVKYP
jgi:hypothetical protein